MTWSILIYKIPSDPSRLRTFVWRELKRLGALYLQQAVCILPAQEGLRRELRGLKQRIESFGGEAILLEEVALPFPEDEAIQEKFRRLRDKEYLEFIEQNQAFHREIAREIERMNFSSEEVEEEEEEYQKLISWLRKIQERDWFSAPLREKAEATLSQSRELLEDFTQRVLEAVGEEDNDGPADNI
ncbi:MAG: hypothetical protein M1299_02780 [Firmicutes bacterium]|nr:hypothetical protein [Bacillota bacterium]MCL5038746.1 hypothetical protein [Bacillota bacterium]